MLLTSHKAIWDRVEYFLEHRTELAKRIRQALRNENFNATTDISELITAAIADITDKAGLANSFSLYIMARIVYHRDEMNWIMNARPAPTVLQWNLNGILGRILFELQNEGFNPPQ